MSKMATPETKKWLFLLATMLALVACTKDGNTIYQTNPDEEKPSTAPLVTVIYGPNGLGDRSYNDLIYKGVEAAAKKHGVRTLHLSPVSEEQGLAYLDMMFRQMENASDSVRRLFITPSPVYDAYIRKNNKRLEKNPNADLLYMETTTPLEGKGSTLYIDYYGAMYMGGCLSHAIQDGVVTLILANPYTQTVVEAGEGFEAGFNDSSNYHVKNEVVLHKRYLSYEPVGGFTIADTTATRIINEEEAYLKVIDYLMIVPVCGGSMHSFIRSLWQTLGGYEYYFGIDGDMTADRRFCALSILKRIDTVMIDYIGMWLQGTMPKHQTLGLKDDATDVVLGYVAEDVPTNEVDSLRQVAIRKEGERYGK